MSYATIIAGLKTAVETVSGIKETLEYEPQAVQVSPLAYIMLDSYERTQHGQVTAMRYRILVRVCIKWQANKEAELELVGLAASVATAVDADPQLGGAVSSGIAQSPDGRAVWVTIAGTLYRALDVFVSVLDKTAYAGAIS